MFQLLQADLNQVVNDVNNSGSYIPVAIQILLVVGLISFLLAMTHWLGPKRKTADKLENFASGIESHGEAPPANGYQVFSGRNFVCIVRR